MSPWVTPLYIKLLRYLRVGERWTFGTTLIHLTPSRSIGRTHMSRTLREQPPSQPSCMSVREHRHGHTSHTTWPPLQDRLFLSSSSYTRTGETTKQACMSMMFV